MKTTGRDDRKPDGKCGTRNLILRCKKCKAAQTHVLDVFRRYRHTDKFGSHKYGYHTMLQDGRDPSWLAGPERPVCCGRPMEWNEVQGHYSAAHECGPKCLSATGPRCDCSCAGKNHGAGYIRG